MPRRASLVRLAALVVATGTLLGVSVGTTVAVFTATTTNPASSFSAAASFCTRANAVWATGMEHGVVSTVGSGIFSSLTTTGGTPTADTAVKRYGLYSLKLVKTNAGASHATRSITASATVVARIAVRLGALPSADVGLFFVDSTPDLVFGYDSATQKFELTLSGASAVSSSTVAANTWYVIDLRLDASANPHTANWRVNEVVQTSLSSANTATTATAVAFGSLTGSHAYTAYWDDMIVSRTGPDYPIGSGKIARLLPNAMGTHSGSGNFQDDDNTAVDANSYQRLDDVPLTATSDYVKQVTLSTGSYIELGFENTSDTCIRVVSAVLAYHAAGTTANDGKTSVYDGSTESVVYSGAMNVTALNYKAAVVTPANGGVWTSSTVNSLVGRVGYASDASPNPYWDALILEYAGRTTCFDAGSQTIITNADSWTDQAAPSTNQGSDSNLYVQSKSGSQNRRSFVNFALPTIPSGCAVIDARLRLYNNSPASGRIIEAYRAAASWTENGVTWSNQPGTTGSAATATAPSSAGWMEWTVTTQVQAMVAGSNYGFLVRDQTENSAASPSQNLKSREDAPNDPELIVTWG